MLFCGEWELQQVPTQMSLTVCSHPGIHSKSCVQKIKISYYTSLIYSGEVAWILQMVFWASQFKKNLRNWRVRRIPSWQGSGTNTTNSRGWRRWTGLVWQWGGQAAWKGRHKDDGAKLFWTMANGEMQDHKLPPERFRAIVLTRRTAQHWDSAPREGPEPLPREHCRTWSGLTWPRLRNHPAHNGNLRLP